MQNVVRASYDVAGRLHAADRKVVWLQPRAIASLDPHRSTLAPRSLRRLGASLSVSIALNLSMAGIAFAPAAQAVEDDGPPMPQTEVSSPVADNSEAARVITVNESPEADEASEADAADDADEPAAVDASAALECDESEIAE